MYVSVCVLALFKPPEAVNLEYIMRCDLTFFIIGILLIHSKRDAVIISIYLCPMERTEIWRYREGGGGGAAGYGGTCSGRKPGTLVGRSSIVLFSTQFKKFCRVRLLPVLLSGENSGAFQPSF